jgi:hypothetical protein
VHQVKSSTDFGAVEHHELLLRELLAHVPGFLVGEGAAQLQQFEEELDEARAHALLWPIVGMSHVASARRPTRSGLHP